MGVLEVRIPRRAEVYEALCQRAAFSLGSHALGHPPHEPSLLWFLSSIFVLTSIPAFLDLFSSVSLFFSFLPFFLSPNSSVPLPPPPPPPSVTGHLQLLRTWQVGVLGSTFLTSSPVILVPIQWELFFDAHIQSCPLPFQGFCTFLSCPAA